MSAVNAVKVFVNQCRGTLRGDSLWDAGGERHDHLWAESFEVKPCADFERIALVYTLVDVGVVEGERVRRRWINGGKWNK